MVKPSWAKAEFLGKDMLVYDRVKLAIWRNSNSHTQRESFVVAVQLTKQV